MVKVKSLEVREVEYTYETRPKIVGSEDMAKTIKPLIVDPYKEFFICLYLNYLNTRNGILK